MVMDNIQVVVASEGGSLEYEDLRDGRLTVKYTPGVIVEVGDYWLDVSFEPDRTLRFVTLANGRYALDATAVRYGDTLYEVDCVRKRSENCPPTLKIRGNFETETTTKRRKVTGLLIE